MNYRNVVSLVAFLVLLSLVSCQQGADPEAEADGETTADMEGTHEDHDPKHGGIFFMALDEVHHLEGTLSSPGVFRVYLYDAMTIPLASDRMAQASGTLHWGEFPDPPAIPLKAGNEEGMLMAELDREIELPLTLTLMLNFPGAPEGESELFNFIFDEYSKPPVVEGDVSHEDDRHEDDQ